MKPLDITGAIDPTDPLLEHFALQHDLRERFLHALEEIIAMYKTQHATTAEMEMIAQDAIDDDKLQRWNEMGRPLPWMDEKINPVAARVRADVLRALGIPEVK